VLGSHVLIVGCGSFANFYSYREKLVLGAGRSRPQKIRYIKNLLTTTALAILLGMADDTPQEPVLDPSTEANTEQAPSVEAPEESAPVPVPLPVPQSTANDEPPTVPLTPDPAPPPPVPDIPEPTPAPQTPPTAPESEQTAPPTPENTSLQPAPEPVKPQPEHIPEPPTPPTPEPLPAPPKPEPTPQVSDIKPQVSDADIVQSLTDEQLKLASSLYARKHQSVLSRKGVEARQAIAQKNITDITAFVRSHSPANNRTIARALNLPPRRVQHYMQQLTHEGVVMATGWGISREYKIKN
jgi:predicted transcriptional regulator